ncbi:MAG: 2Fe-2S iron-sulfur cluster binding domain-containing protein [Planctomycetes bacterium]|nr:2Fe-2S iron-sulfur cluster binding domain-containing protein [Planctomycetota bacterium]
MPKVIFSNEKLNIDAADGANLRETALAAGIQLYRGPARLLNCRGRGDCKTCKVKIEPDKNASPRTAAELPRAHGRILQMIDHRELIGWRLACQVRIRGEIDVATQC